LTFDQSAFDFLQKILLSQVPVALAGNPSYPGGREQEDRSLKQIVCVTLSQKKKSQKRAGGVA
jgi:hypothetical protein